MEIGAAKLASLILAISLKFTVDPPPVDYRSQTINDRSLHLPRLFPRRRRDDYGRAERAEDPVSDTL